MNKNQRRANRKKKSKLAKKAAKAAAAANAGLPAVPGPSPLGGFVGVGPPQAPRFMGPMNPPECFPMGPPGFRQPAPYLMQRGPFLNDPEFGMRDRYMHGPGGPDFQGRPPGFHPPGFWNRPPGFVPPPFGDGHPGFGLPEFRGGPPGFISPEFRCDQRYPRMEAAGGPVNAGGAVHLGCTPQKEAHGMNPGPPNRTQPTNSDSKNPTKNENAVNKNATAKALSAKTDGSVIKSTYSSVKPPAGRSTGVITFIGPDYGLIENLNQKKYWFSFEAFFGHPQHLLPRVKVHFTAVKESDKVCATDVKVAPGGTDDIEATVYEGVVIKVLSDFSVPDPHPGCIRTILNAEPVKLPFGKTDTKITLLMFDRVKFQLLTDLLTKKKRATNITPQMPETFLLTKEIREKGVIMDIKGDTFTVMSQNQSKISGPVKEYLSNSELNLMDEVEFTIQTVSNSVTAIRLLKLPEGSVNFESQENSITAKVINPDPNLKWKPVISKPEEPRVEEIEDDISSERYEGIVLLGIPKHSIKLEPETKQEPPKGLVSYTVEGTQKRLPFGLGDVMTQATMMIGDKVQFNIATKRKTKEERAINIVILPETFQTGSTKEKRTVGVVVQLNDNSGFIKTLHDPQLFFDQSEVLDDTKLTLSEEVEFTLAPNKGAEDGKRVLRIRRLEKSDLPPSLKIEEKKEKKKMTIKLQMDLKEKCKSKVTTECMDDLLATEKPDSQTAEPVKAPKQESQGEEGKSLTDKLDKEYSRSRERTRYRHSRSSSQNRESSSHSRPRSSSRDRSCRNRRRSRSRSRDRSHRYTRSRSRSRERHSRSHRRTSRSHRRTSRSPEYRDKLHSKRQSTSSDRKTEGLKKMAASQSDAPCTEDVGDELESKRKELLELNELIARAKAIIAMEQSNLPFTDTYEVERQSRVTTFDYQHKPSVGPVKSILKKPTESLANLQHQTHERSGSPEEYQKSYSPSAGSAPPWIKQSSTPEIEDPELARKKRKLQELNESIARKRAILAMQQKAKKIKTEHDSTSSLHDLDMATSEEDTWQLDIKPENQPKKSILKTRSEGLANKLQRDMTSGDKYDCASFQTLEDDYLASPKPSEPSPIPREKSITKTLVSPDTFDLFKKLINEASTRSSMSKSSSFNKPAGQRSLGSTDSQNSLCFPQNHDQASTSKGSSTQSSASGQKSNVSKQMDRFLSALNKADSSMLSALMQDDADNLDYQRNILQADSKRPLKEELYDPFSETNDNEDSSHLMDSKQSRIPLLGQMKYGLDDYGHDDLLPHERAVQDGSGFSKIVGMKYGSDTKAENRFLFGGSSSQSTLSKKLLSEEDNLYKLSQGQSVDEHSADSYQPPRAPVQNFYTDDGEKYKMQKETQSFEGRGSPIHQKSEDDSEDVTGKADHFKTFQDLLQTIGLNLDTAEVSKLTDRTRERLYGKKVKPQRASSLSSDQKDERSGRRYDRRDSSHSSDSEDAQSRSPAKSSKREVYMSYRDSIKYRHDDAAVVPLRRTISNSPETRQVASDPSRPPVTPDTYQPILETSSLAPPIGSLYTQGASTSTYQFSYAAGQNEMGNHFPPYNTNFMYPMHYASGYTGQYDYFPPGYGTYAASASYSSMMPPSFIPPVSSYSTTPAYPPPVSQFGVQTKSSVFTQPIRAKARLFLKPIKTQNQGSVPDHIPDSPKDDVIEKRVTRSSVRAANKTQANAAAGEAESQAAPLAEDDIKAKQKKRLEQFNQRMKLKKEQQMEAQRLRGQNQKSAPGKVTQTEVKNVWICGHSLVFWAEKRATSPEIGMQLGMDSDAVRIWWKGVQGMTWEQLLPQLLQLKDNWPKPDVIILHLGGNDIGKTVPDAFVAAVKKDLASLKSIFPECLLVWSDILPRKSWRHSDDSEAVNHTRATINEAIHGIVSELSGASLTHENIMPRLDYGLYRPDGVHLSGKGIDTFNLNLQDFLEKWEAELSKPDTSEVQD